MAWMGEGVASLSCLVGASHLAWPQESCNLDPPIALCPPCRGHAGQGLSHRPHWLQGHLAGRAAWAMLEAWALALSPAPTHPHSTHLECSFFHIFAQRVYFLKQSPQGTLPSCPGTPIITLE